MTGVKAEDMVGKGDYEYAIPFYGMRRPILIDLVFTSDEEIEKKYRFIERTGDILLTEADVPLNNQKRILWGKARPLYNSGGNIVGAIESIRDITDRKHTEEALRVSERKFRAIFDQTFQFIGLMTVDGILIETNRTALIFSGIEESDVIGKPFWETPWWTHSPELQRQLCAAIKKAAEGEFVRFEATHHAADGSLRYIDFSLKPVIDEAGKVVLLIPEGRDITDRKHTEEEKRSIEERLQRAEKMEALGTLAGGVAHDLNNSLGIVVGYSEMLLDEVDDSSAIRTRLERIMKGGKKATEIVQDMLTMARRGVPNRQVLNLNKIIADCQQSPEFEKLFSYHPSVKIKTDLEPDLLKISGSSVQLGKTLYNLISNATEAMPKGGTLTIKTANQYLDKPIQGYDQIRKGDYVVLAMSDGGEGIPAADLKRIFEPFYTKKVMGRRSGTGLGLAVVWGTVKDHNGYINVQSEEGKGSTFTIYFPVTREEIFEDEIFVHVSEYMGNGESILVVDDGNDQCELAAQMLGKLNYNVATASSGEEAVEYVKQNEVDLIVLDMIMDPGMDGLDTYRSVLEIYPRQKAIIVSGFSETDRVSAAQKLGAGAYVRKPYVIEKVGLAVRKELDRK
jgi:PAS domain S-box-containing protein